MLTSRVLQLKKMARTKKTPRGRKVKLGEAKGRDMVKSVFRAAAQAGQARRDHLEKTIQDQEANYLNRQEQQRSSDMEDE